MQASEAISTARYQGESDSGGEALHPELRSTRQDPTWRDHLATLTLFFIMGSWFAYLVGASLLWANHPGLAALATLTVGAFLQTWLGYYRHELWHNYIPWIHNPTWFNYVSHLMFSDPQVYRVAHPAHHKHIHTVRDPEFFCENFDEDPRKRKRQFLLELAFGNMAWELDTLHRLKREGKACKWKGRRSLMKRIACLGAAAVVVWTIQPGAQVHVLVTFVTTSWIGALLTRHNQWIEHLGTRAEGASLLERDMMSRNLPTTGPLSWLWNVYNHNDAREHTLHHTHPKWNSRGHPEARLPPGAATTTLMEHFFRLRDHYAALSTGSMSCSSSSIPCRSTPMGPRTSRD